MSKYPLLNDRDWLHTKYVTEKLSTKKIAKLVGAKSPNSVRQALIKFNIPVRGIPDGYYTTRKDDGFVINHDVIEGCLLGDACLTIWNKKSKNSSPCFCKGNIHLEHIEYVAKELFPYTWNQRIDMELREKLGKKDLYLLRSFTHQALKPYFERWYPLSKEYTKHVPEDLLLTPTVLLHWFLDDGNSYQRRKTSKTKQVVITFCTESFPKTNQEMLQAKLFETFGLKVRLAKQSVGGYNYRLVLIQSQASYFYDLIGPSPIQCMRYKWK